MGQNTAILDIGSSKVICLICGTDGRDNILVQGAGIKEYPGYKHGAFEDEQQLADAIIDALSAAQGARYIRWRSRAVYKAYSAAGRSELQGQAAANNAQGYRRRYKCLA